MFYLKKKICLKKKHFMKYSSQKFKLTIFNLTKNDALIIKLIANNHF